VKINPDAIYRVIAGRATVRPGDRINFELLDTHLGKLAANPEIHQQGLWLERVGETCGTVGCIAGWVAHDTAGDMIKWFSRRDLVDDGDSFARVIDEDGRYISVSEWSTYQLGLTLAEAGQLYAASNDLAGMYSMRNRWAKRAGIDPIPLPEGVDA
jgi:hypothetical protein